MVRSSLLNLFLIACLAVPVLARAQAPMPAPDPVSSAIATALVAYFNSQEGQCQLHACSCDKCNQGAKNKCHEIARRLGEYSKSPTTYNASQVEAITGSKRTQCMARALVSGSTWAAFQSRQPTNPTPVGTFKNSAPAPTR